MGQDNPCSKVYGLQEVRQDSPSLQVTHPITLDHEQTRCMYLAAARRLLLGSASLGPSRSGEPAH